MRLLLKGIKNLESKENCLETLEISEQNKSNHSLEHLKKLIFDNFKESFKDRKEEDFSIYSNGKFIQDKRDLKIYNNQILEIKYCLIGGKGGFGSLLKAQPAIKKRTNNFDSCRDLSGRRLRHVNQEKMLRDWQQKKVEEEKMLKEYTNSSNKSDIGNYSDALYQKEIESINRDYKEANHEVSESVSSSIKYLMRKKQRDHNKPKPKIEKLDLKEYNNKKTLEYNNIDIENFKQENHQTKAFINNIQNNTICGISNNNNIKANNNIFMSKSANIEKDRDIRKNKDKTLENINKVLRDTIYVKANKSLNDNLSNISDESYLDYNKEELEKALIDF